jgi:hypothetical protein
LPKLPRRNPAFEIRVYRTIPIDPIHPVAPQVELRQMRFSREIVRRSPGAGAEELPKRSSRGGIAVN